MLSRLLLRVAKVGWTCHDAVCDDLTELSCRILLDLPQYVSGDLLCIKLSIFVANVHLDHGPMFVVLHQLVIETVAELLHYRVVPVPANEPFSVVNRKLSM